MTVAIRRALYGRLASDTTLVGMLADPPSGYNLAIFFIQAPQDAQYPLVVFSRNSGTPIDTFGEPGAFENDLWLIKAVDAGNSSDNAEAISERIAELLNDASLSIAGASTDQYLRRESDIEYGELSQGTLYRHHGSLYRLITSPA